MIAKGMDRKRLLNSLESKNRGRPPVWIMRQAGRYLPEYQEIRKKHPFLEMCHKPDVACEVTLTPFKRFDFDAAILFSDILMIPEAYGLGLSFEEGVGPKFSKELIVEKLPEISLKQFDFIDEAIHRIKEKLDRPLLGFAGAPFTVASYMIEGGSGKFDIKTKKMLFGDPKGMHRLLEKLTEDTIAYLKLQQKAGCDALQIFESSLFTLGPNEAKEFSFPYIKRIVEALDGAPLLIYAKGSARYVDELAALGARGLSLDWQCNLPEVRRRYPELVLQGNLDPTLLFAPKERIQREVNALLDQMNGDPSYILNLGHGILPTTPLAGVEALMETLQCRS